MIVIELPAQPPLAPDELDDLSPDALEAALRQTNAHSRACALKVIDAYFDESLAQGLAVVERQRMRLSGRKPN